MRKKEFKMHVATNPMLRQWLTENAMWLKAKPEVMMYITQHADGMKHFKGGQPIDNEKIHRNAQAFMQQMVQERMNRKKNKQLNAEAKKNKPPKEKKKGGLLSNIKSIFNKPAAVPAAASATAKPNGAVRLPAQMPMLHPPGYGPMPSRLPAARPAARTAAKPQAKKTSLLGSFKIPKIKVNRKKMMSTLNQTTEMLDVVAALMGRVGNLK